MSILVINSGSSSLKLGLFAEDRASEKALWSKKVEGSDCEDLRSVIAELQRKFPEPINAVGHRIVHGGAKYSASTIIDDGVIDDLRQCIELAPSHEAANIQGIVNARAILPEAAHIAVFDTSYHYGMPLSSQLYAVPREWYEEMGIRRYGFHGINHRYCVERLSESRVITCHLGSGASLCASLDRRSQMTTMGYTPLEGLIMRTRSGTIDPGMILLLMQKHKYTVDDLTRILNQESGLKALSGLTGDMRELEGAIEENNARARLAFEIYIQNLAANISALVPILGGLDALVFTGGIGEHSSRVRGETCAALKFLGLTIDNQKNASAASLLGDSDGLCEISSGCAAIKTYIIAAGEELGIARECARLLAG